MTLDPDFIRQQMQSRLHEFIMYYNAYIEHANEQRESIVEFLPEGDKREFEQFLSELEPFNEAAQEMIDEIDIRYERLKTFWEISQQGREKYRSQLIKQFTFSHKRVRITRKPLHYSSYGASAGYDASSQSLDIEYNSGKIYRYFDVPKDVFDRITTLKSLRDLKSVIDTFEFEKLN